MGHRSAIEIEDSSDIPHHVAGAEKTPSELIEEGVGLIVKGMFRRGDKSAGADPQSAYEDGMAAVSVIREMAFGFLRLANAKSATQDKKA